MLSNISDIKRYRAKERIRKTGTALLRWLFLAGFIFVIIYPVINMLTRSFMTPADWYDNSVLWLPQHFTLANIKVAGKSLNYGKAFVSSVLYCVAITLLQLFSCTTAGYAFARYKFPGSRILFAGVILTLIIPPQVTMVSSYISFGDFNILGGFFRFRDLK